MILLTDNKAKYLRNWRKKNPEKASEYCKNYRERNPGIASRQMKEYRARVRLEVLLHYSGGTPHCACCGEDNMEFLCIDHINGSGNEERKKTGSYIYSWLRARHFPIGYRVLCHNCNSALGFYGYCPHQILEGDEK